MRKLIKCLPAIILAFLILGLVGTYGYSAYIVRLTSQSLAGGALDYTTDINQKFKVWMVTLKASQAITDTFTIGVNSLYGADFDTLIVSEALSAATDFVYMPENLILTQGDELDIDCTNTTAAGTIFVQVVADTFN